MRSQRLRQRRKSKLWQKMSTCDGTYQYHFIFILVLSHTNLHKQVDLAVSCAFVPKRWKSKNMDLNLTWRFHLKECTFYNLNVKLQHMYRAIKNI